MAKPGCAEADNCRKQQRKRPRNIVPKAERL
jgi:hypothetical protein